MKVVACCVGNRACHVSPEEFISLDKCTPVFHTVLNGLISSACYQLKRCIQIIYSIYISVHKGNMTSIISNNEADQWNKLLTAVFTKWGFQYTVLLDADDL